MNLNSCHFCHKFTTTPYYPETNHDFVNEKMAYSYSNVYWIMLGFFLLVCIISSCLKKKKKIKATPAVLSQPQPKADMNLYFIQMLPTSNRLYPELSREDLQYSTQAPNNPFYPQLELNADEDAYVHNPSVSQARANGNRNISLPPVNLPSAPVLNEPVYIHNIY